MGLIEGGNKRIAQNTLLLYFRMLFMMVISLYTSRVILQVLGVEDYGIYSVVGGLVSMFSLISNSLSNCIGRFIAFEIGRNDLMKLKKTFSVAVSIYIILALVTFVAVEAVAVWFLNTKMNIAKENMIAANWVLQFSLLTFIVNLISIPYNATIIAHERMSIFAYISIFEAISKLVVVYLLLLSSHDRLILYAFLLFLLSLFIRIIYGIYCKRQFEECSVNFIWDKPIVLEMFNMAGWNFLSSMADIFKSQGVAILINLFFGTFVNAAQAIAQQVNNAVNQFCNNFMTAITPQITKSYAQENYMRVEKLSMIGSRYSFYLVMLFSLPILYETNFILELWLGVVPTYTIIFVQYALIQTAFEVLSRTLINIIMASGYVRKYQIGVSLLLFANFPLSYFLLKMGFDADSVYIVAILITISTLLWRFYIAHTLMHFNVKYYVKNVFIYPILIAVICSIPYSIIVYHMPIGIWRFGFSLIIGIIFTLLIIYLIGINSRERMFVNSFIVGLRNKIYRNNRYDT